MKTVILGSAGCQPAVAGSLPATPKIRLDLECNHRVVIRLGKLPRRTGWQAALPRIHSQ